MSSRKNPHRSLVALAGVLVRAARVGLCAAAVATLIAACGETSDTGGLMLVVRSDMNVGVDFDTIRIEVAAGDTLLHDASYAVGPKGYVLPSTLALIAGKTTPVLLRVTARQGSKLRVFWQARTLVPRGRVATLSADLVWACDGRAMDTPTGVVSTCVDGLTCVDGSCVAPDVDSSKLPEFDPATAAPCSDTTSDPNNCGSCGHDCLGGACTAGRCQPRPLATVEAAQYLFGDASFLYVGTNSNTPSSPGKATLAQPLLRIDKANLATKSILPPGPYAWDMHRQPDDSFFVTSARSVLRVDPSGAVRKLATFGNLVERLTVTPSQIYTTSFFGDALYRLSFDGTFSTVAQIPSAEGMCEDQDFIYVSQQDQVTQFFRLSKATGAIAPWVALPAKARRAVVDGDYLYWTSFARDYGRTRRDTGASETYQLPTDIKLGDLAMDGDTMLVASPDAGILYAIPKAAFSTNRRLVEAQSGIVGLHVDQRAIYWTQHESGAVVRLAR